MSQSKPKSSKGTSQTNQPASAGGGSGSTNDSTQSKNGGSPRTNLVSNNSAMVPTTVNYLVDNPPASLSLTAMPVLKDTSTTTTGRLHTDTSPTAHSPTQSRSSTLAVSNQA